MRLLYMIQGAPQDHPLNVMKHLCAERNLTISSATPQSAYDCWEFEVPGGALVKWPDYIVPPFNNKGEAFE